MTQEWEMSPVELMAFDRLTEDFEKRMTAALPGILTNLIGDLFDDMAPGRYAGDDETEAYEAAAKNVVGNLLRLIAEDQASIEEIRRALLALGRERVVGSTPEGQTP